MAKFSRYQKLSSEKTQSMVIDLCEGMAATQNSQEAAKLLTDLLGKQELEMIAKRLAIAELLLDNCTYEDIVRELKTSSSTIARVEAWLQDSGEGYRMIIERTKRKRKSREENEKPVKLAWIKKKYPLYYWPQTLLQYWIHNSTVKQKREMQNILNKINSKKQVNQELEKLLRQSLTVKR